MMLPRLQHPGLKPKHVERDAFKAELRHVEGRGDFWLLFQQSKPHVVAHVQFSTLTRFNSHIWNSNECTSDSVFKYPSSTIRQHGFLKTQILYTMYSQTNLWNHHIGFSSMNTRANAWNARCHQGNGNIVVQRLVHLSKFRASAPS